MGRLIIDGNRIYELDEACVQRKKQRNAEQTKDGSASGHRQSGKDASGRKNR